MTKDAFYFHHDSNAQNDEKILQLRAKHGWFGYGLYWAIIERLRDQKDYMIPVTSVKALSFGLMVEPDILQNFVNDCFNIGLLTNDGTNLFSDSLLRRMRNKDERHERFALAGRKGGLISSQAKATLKPGLSHPQAKEEKIREEKIKDKKTEKSVESVFLDELKKLYPAISLETELTKMRGWLLSRPNRKLTRRFAVNWLNRRMEDNQEIKTEAKSGPKPFPKDV